MRSFFIACMLIASPSCYLFSQGLPADQAAERMTAADGLGIRLVASEPLVRQPVAIEFDDRARLWVIQYLQYPNPEGLKRKKVDRYSRTEYDRVPEPPPRGPAGSDRITILSDADGDGVMDRSQDFVTGLNLASGLAFGHGGVFVLNVPYLLYYPDRNRDDVPDSDPDVLLTGFGMQDAHSVANSLTWGPDGWLYGCQGSTVTSNIRGIEFQQGVWRYHPRTKAFELFCEGGGNAWGLDFDADGHLLYSTNYGGYVLVHGVQGGNYVKSFAKHGQLHNRFAYGYFEHAPHKEFFGGHVTVGGIVVQKGALPDQFTGKYLAGDLLGHAAYYHRLIPHGSTFKTETVGKLLDSHDTWFAPTDLTVGFDGDLYIADWHDARTAHPDPDAQWDRSNGRIYRLFGKDIARTKVPPIDLANTSPDELLRIHSEPSQHLVRRARQELVRRHATELLPQLLQLALTPSEPVMAREAFWSFLSLQDPTVEGSPQLQAAASRLLQSPLPVIRYWTVRWLGDCGSVTSELAHQLDELAETETSLHVRSQLASTAARLPAKVALPIVNANINRDIDNDDLYLPLQWWWAVEHHSITGRDEVMKRFTRPSLWKSKLGRDLLLPRLTRRYMAEGEEAGFESVLRLLKAAPNPAARDAMWPAMVLGWQESGRRDSADAQKAARSHPLALFVHSEWNERPSLALARLSILLGNESPRQQAYSQAMDQKLGTPVRLAALQLLMDHPEAAMTDGMLQLYDSSEQEVIRQAALRVLGKLDSNAVAETIIKHLLEKSKGKSDQGPAAQQLEHELLFSRRSWAKLWLDAVDRQELAKDSVTLEQVRLLMALEDDHINRLVAKHWGKLSTATPEEKLAEVRRLNNDLRASAGDVVNGKLLFKTHCSTCHRLHDEGGKVGPDLTSANRKDRDFLLVSLVDPSSVIRKEYLSVIVHTDDDRIFTGIPIPSTDGATKLVNAKGETITVPASEVAEITQSNVSIMPEGLLKALSPQELRDLFGYIGSSGSQ